MRGACAASPARRVPGGAFWVPRSSPGRPFWPFQGTVSGGTPHSGPVQRRDPRLSVVTHGTPKLSCTETVCSLVAVWQGAGWPRTVAPGPHRVATTLRGGNYTFSGGGRRRSRLRFNMYSRFSSKLEKIMLTANELHVLQAAT